MKGFRMRGIKMKGNKTKGMIMSIIAFLILASIFSIAYVFSSSNIQVREIVAQDILANRIYYKFLTISDSAIEIIVTELGDIAKILLNVSVDEQPDFSYVAITEKFPQNVTDFNEDLVRYEKFVEGYLNETNIEIDTGIGGLGGRMRIEIEPYGIVYDHIPPWGQRQYSVTPANANYSLDKLNSYNFTVQLTDGWKAMPSKAVWGPKKAGDLKVSIRVVSDGGVPTYETTEYLSRTVKSAFQIGTNYTSQSTYREGWVRFIISEDSPGSVMFQMHQSQAIVTTALNLTDIPGKTRVNFPDGRINVIENKYIIQKNDTVSIW